MRVYKPTFKDKKTGEIKKVGKWWVSLKDHREIIRRFAGFTDKGQTELFGRQIERLINYRAAGEQPDAQLSRWLEQVSSKLRDKFAKMGLLDSNRAAAGKPLQKHIEDFEQVLLAKNTTEQHAKLTANRVRRIVKGCRFQNWSEIQASRVQTFLAGLRDEGLSAQSSNFYLQAVRQFAKWMIQDGRATVSPIEHLKGLNVRTDRRHDRRALEPDEIRRLLETTAAGPVRYGMDGRERSLLYRFGCETGLRANELRSLKVADFDFSARTVTVSAGYSKRRRQDVIQIRPDTAAELREYLSNKLPTAKVFGGTYRQLTKRTSDMIREDLQAVGIDYINDSGQYADFHSLRHSTGSLLAAVGVHPRTAQQILRHSKVDLTLSRYTHVYAGQVSDALDKLPDLSQPSKQRQQAAATGTDDARPVVDSSRISSPDRPKPKTVVDGNGRKQENTPHGTKSGQTALAQEKTPISGQKTERAGFEPALGAEPPRRFSKPLPENPKCIDNKPLTQNAKTDLLPYLSDYPDLAEIVKLWPDLPEHIKAAIKALAQTHIEGKK